MSDRHHAVKRLTGLLSRPVVLAFVAIAIAFGYLQQGPGYEQNGHYLLVRGLAHGRTTVEDELEDIGELSTQDILLRDGHLYSNKSPGLAFLSVPAYVVAEAAGVPTHGDPTTMLWALGLWSVALPTLLLVLVVRDRAKRLAPGTGTIVGFTMGLGTLLLPFSGAFFHHSLGAFLGFAAFAVLWREREADPRLSFVAAGGLVAGLAVTTEYPTAVAAGILGIYACARTPRVRRGLAYCGGLVTGVLPLVLYNLAAFGNPFSLSFRARPPGESDPGFRTGGTLGHGVFGIDVPRPHAAFDVLFSAQGLFTVAPVLFAALVGLVLAFRTHREEALVVAAIVLAYLVWDSGFSKPAGGLLPGPRYLIFILPFLAVMLAPAFRAFPLPTLALAAVSSANMILISATGMHPAFDGQWVERATARAFRPTALAAIEITGWYTIIPFFAACVVAAALAASTFRPPLGALPLLATIIVLGAWVWLAPAAPSEHGRFELGYVSTVALLALACIVATAAWPRREAAQPGPALETGVR